MKTQKAPQSAQPVRQAHVQAKSVAHVETGAAVADNREGTARQLHLLGMMRTSPRVAQLEAQLSGIHNGSRAVAQRRRMAQVFDGVPAERGTLGAFAGGHAVQRRENTSQPNGTGLPDGLKAGVESLSGMSLDHVKVHYDSPRPAQLNALAYTQGSEIHVGSGQERHLPHETWHVVQQAQGRVGPTMQMAGVAVNDDGGLEAEADVMGARALAYGQASDEGTRERWQRGDSGRPMRTLVDARTDDCPTIQRKPADFLLPKQLCENKKARHVKNKIEEYRTLDPSNINKRKALLDNLEKAIKGCELEYKNGQMHETDEYLEQWLKSLNLQIEFEKSEIELSGGSMQINQKQEISVDPNISCTLKSVKGGPEGGVFKEDTDIVDDKNNKIDQGQKGMSLLIVDKSNAVSQVNKATHDKVEPESKGAINRQNFKPGWALSTKILRVNRLAPQHNVTHVLQNDPLFSHPPTKDDILQGSLGDCYLLAALSSVALREPDLLVQHMKDHGNGMVSVKMYRVENDPVIVTVNKSVAMRKDHFYSKEKEEFSKGAMWVKMYEKAYVAAGFHGSTLETLHGPQKSYGMIDGGGPSVALTHITGRAAQGNAIDGERTDVHGILMNLIKQIAQKLDPAMPTYATTLHTLYVEVPGELEKLLEKTRVSRHDMVALLESCKIDKHTISEIEKTLIDARILTGALGSGEYTKAELELFARIESDLNNRRHVVIGTKEKFYDSPQDVEAQRGNAGEVMAKGLAGPHAYAVLDYAPRAHQQHQMHQMQQQMQQQMQPHNGTLSLKLRNPWGNYGVGYRKKGTNVPIKIEIGETFNDAERFAVDGPGSGEFWIDIADVAAFFNSYDVA